MVSTPRILAGALSATAGTAAVSVPVALHVTGNSRVKRNVHDDSNNTGGGVNQVSVSQCVGSISENYKNIEFGEQESGNICGSSELAQDLTKPEDGTELFKEQWKDKNRKGNSNDNESGGMSQCLDNEKSSQGAITVNSGSGFQYLGLCGNTAVNETKFVKKNQKSHPNSDNWSISICGNNCGSLNGATFGGSPEILETEQQRNWKEVKFYVYK